MKFFCPKTRLLQHNFFFCFLVGTLFLALPALTFAVPGDLDTSFGNGGKVTILIGFWSSANGVIVQADGKIVVAGKDYDKMSLARYNTDGSLDTSFGISGSVTTSVGQFNSASDIASPGDYDGDGRTDAAVFRPSTGTWWMLRSTAGFNVTQFGLNDDIPVPSVR